jgi:uncharacterized protein
MFNGANMAETREAITIECEGQKIFGILHLPKVATSQKFPAVLLCHGFGGNKSGKFRLYVRLAQRLAEHGIASLRIDFRGSGDSEGEFQETTIQSLFQDANSALTWLKSHPAIDERRIGIAGRSLGGMVSIHVASHAPIRAVALWAPVYDVKPWLSKFAPGGVRFEHLGVPVNDEFIRQFLLLVTQAALESLVKVPLLHIQGQNDKSVEKYHTEQYEIQRKSATAQTKFISLAKSDHDFSDNQEQEVTLQETVAWFEKYLRELQN